MKRPDRQPEKSTSTALKREVDDKELPPPNRARFETDVAARYCRPALREAVVHNPDVTLKISTAFELMRSSARPPPKRARFETDAEARAHRATLRLAVVHNPEVTL
jgi:hypothetical protein